MKLSQFLVKESGPPGPCPIESDPAFYGANDFAELVHVNVCVGSKQDMSAIRGVGQLRPRFDLECDPVKSVDVLEHDFEVDMKIAGQFIRPKDLESGNVGPRCGEIDGLPDISAPDIRAFLAARLVTLLKLGKRGQCPAGARVSGRR